MKTRIFAVLLALLTLVSCGKRQVSSYYDAGTTFLNTESDGSITVRASGQGRNAQDAIEQAWKNAVKDVMLKGVQVPGNTFLSKPLITEVNAEEKYASFIYSFLADQGEYLNFISTEDKKVGSTDKARNDVQVRRVVTVRVLRQDLKNYLIQQNIIKP